MTQDYRIFVFQDKFFLWHELNARVKLLSIEFVNLDHLLFYAVNHVNDCLLGHGRCVTCAAENSSDFVSRHWLVTKSRSPWSESQRTADHSMGNLPPPLSFIILRNRIKCLWSIWWHSNTWFDANNCLDEMTRRSGRSRIGGCKNVPNTDVKKKIFGIVVNERRPHFVTSKLMLGSWIVAKSCKCSVQISDEKSRENETTENKKENRQGPTVIVHRDHCPHDFWCVQQASDTWSEWSRHGDLSLWCNFRWKSDKFTSLKLIQCIRMHFSSNMEFGQRLLRRNCQTLTQCHHDRPVCCYGSLWHMTSWQDSHE